MFMNIWVFWNMAPCSLLDVSKESTATGFRVSQAFRRSGHHAPSTRQWPYETTRRHIRKGWNIWI